MKYKIEEFDSFADRCPFFYQDKSSIGGYNCKHKECGEGEKGEDGKVIGKCFTFSCPLVPTAEEVDFANENGNVDLNGFEQDDYMEDSFVLVPIK